MRTTSRQLTSRGANVAAAAIEDFDGRIDRCSDGRRPNRSTSGSECGSFPMAAAIVSHPGPGNASIAIPANRRPKPTTTLTNRTVRTSRMRRAIFASRKGNKIGDPLQSQAIARSRCRKSTACCGGCRFSGNISPIAGESSVVGATSRRRPRVHLPTFRRVMPANGRDVCLRGRDDGIGVRSGCFCLVVRNTSRENSEKNPHAGTKRDLSMSRRIAGRGTEDTFRKETGP